VAEFHEIAGHLVSGLKIINADGRNTIFRGANVGGDERNSVLFDEGYDFGSKIITHQHQAIDTMFQQRPDLPQFLFLVIL
jgi:hypothetical protein